jgi:ADP-heptose:LPS heptosyltransferase
VYQIAPPGRPGLTGFPLIRTNSFREAIAVLKASTLYVGPEGGLHHASAAVGTKAVVVFGGYISPKTTGYDFHECLTGGATRGCGTRRGMCEHCLKHLNRIAPEDVLRAARRLLAGAKPEFPGG